MKTINTDKSLRNSQLFGFGSLVVMVGIFGAWSALAELNGAVVAPATIVAETYSKKVQHREGGNVQRIFVKDGDQVEAGQTLVTLDPSDTKAELGVVQGQLAELYVRRGRLEAQRDGKDTIAIPATLKLRAEDPAVVDIISGQQNLLHSTLESAKSKKAQYAEQIAQAAEQTKGYDSQIAADQKQRDLMAKELEGLLALQKKGLVPTTRIVSSQREMARLEGEQGQLTGNRAAIQTRKGEIQLQILQVDEDLRNQALNDLRETESKIAELESRQLGAASRLSRMEIKAPITGTVYQMTLHTEGGVIAPGEAFMMILPKNDDLVLQAQVSPNDINHVHQGQSAHVRFNGFSSRLVPEISAEVTQVSVDTTRNDAQTPPFYAIRLTIPAAELSKLGDNRLKPGMSAEAFIQTESRSPWSYLIKPLTDMFAHAMRET